MTEEDRIKYYQELKEHSGEIPLPNGCTLYWKYNEVGGITYSSDEVGGGVHVWDTALVDDATLLAAIVHYCGISYYQNIKARSVGK